MSMKLTYKERQNAFALISQKVEAENQQLIMYALTTHVREYLNIYKNIQLVSPSVLSRIHDETMTIVDDWIYRKLPDYCKTLALCGQYFRKIDFTIQRSFDDNDTIVIEWNEFYESLHAGTAPINTISWTPQKVEDEWIKLHGTSKRPW